MSRLGLATGASDPSCRRVPSGEVPRHGPELPTGPSGGEEDTEAAPCKGWRVTGFLDEQRGALFGVAGPLLFLVGVILVSWSERDFKTNHPDADVTWHAFIHVVGYFTFFFGLLLAYAALAWGSWNRLARSSWGYAPLALLPWLGVFLLPDGLKASNYLFFAILLSPLLILAIRVLATGGWPAARRADRSRT